MGWQTVNDEDVPKAEFKQLKVVGDFALGLFLAHETRKDTYEGRPNNKETYTIEGLDGALLKVDMPTDAHRKLEVARKRGLDFGHILKVTITKMLPIEGREHPMKVCAVQWTSDTAEIERFRQEQKKRAKTGKEKVDFEAPGPEVREVKGAAVKAAAKPPPTKISDIPDDDIPF